MSPSVSRWCVVVATAVVQAFAAAGATAQETRAEEIGRAQAAKAEQLTPYVPSKAERVVLGLKQKLLETPDGFFPWFDSVYSGGGLTLGGGYREFFGDTTSWEARGLYSFKNYKLFELATASLGLAGGRIDFRGVGGWRDATQVNFYGVGGDTPQEAKSNFRMQQAFAGGLLHGRAPASTIFDFGVQYENYALMSGTGASPSIEDAYSPSSVPGLGDSPSFLRMIATGGVDTRPSPGYARHGGLYALSYEAYLDPDDTYTFDRLQAEIVQHVPFLRETWVLSLHGVARTTLDDHDVVPYFLLPSLGSGSTLRAYPSWRFRDRHSLLLSGEWRWIPNRMFLDMAFFYDTGKVTARREDLDFDGLKHNAGIGIRFHGPIATPLRIDIARGSEGINIVFAGAAAF